MLPFARYLSVVLLKMRRAAVQGATDEKDGERRLRQLDELMAWPVSEEERRASWGQTPEALAEQGAMMSMLGGSG